MSRNASKNKTSKSKHVYFLFLTNVRRFGWIPSKKLTKPVVSGWNFFKLLYRRAIYLINWTSAVWEQHDFEWILQKKLPKSLHSKSLHKKHINFLITYPHDPYGNVMIGLLTIFLEINCFTLLIKWSGNWCLPISKSE